MLPHAHGQMVNCPALSRLAEHKKLRTTCHPCLWLHIHDKVGLVYIFSILCQRIQSISSCQYIKAPEVWYHPQVRGFIDHVPFRILTDHSTPVLVHCDIVHRSPQLPRHPSHRQEAKPQWWCCQPLAARPSSRSRPEKPHKQSQPSC